MHGTHIKSWTNIVKFYKMHGTYIKSWANIVKFYKMHGTYIKTILVINIHKLTKQIKLIYGANLHNFGSQSVVKTTRGMRVLN